MDSNEELELLLELARLARRVVEIELRLQEISEDFSAKEPVTFATSRRAGAGALDLPLLIDVDAPSLQRKRDVRRRRCGRRGPCMGSKSASRRTR